MATAILAKQQGETHQYHLSEAEFFAIRRQAPSWRVGPGASWISYSDIELQRQDFIQINGNDGL